MMKRRLSLLLALLLLLSLSACVQEEPPTETTGNAVAELPVGDSPGKLHFASFEDMAYLRSMLEGTDEELRELLNYETPTHPAYSVNGLRNRRAVEKWFETYGNVTMFYLPPETGFHLYDIEQPQNTLAIRFIYCTKVECDDRGDLYPSHDGYVITVLNINECESCRPDSEPVLYNFFVEGKQVAVFKSKDEGDRVRYEAYIDDGVVHTHAVIKVPDDMEFPALDELFTLTTLNDLLADIDLEEESSP